MERVVDERPAATSTAGWGHASDPWASGAPSPARPMRSTSKPSARVIRERPFVRVAAPVAALVFATWAVVAHRAGDGDITPLLAGFALMTFMTFVTHRSDVAIGPESVRIRSAFHTHVLHRSAITGIAPSAGSETPRLLLVDGTPVRTSYGLGVFRRPHDEVPGSVALPTVPLDQVLAALDVPLVEPERGDACEPD